MLRPRFPETQHFPVAPAVYEDPPAGRPAEQHRPLSPARGASGSVAPYVGLGAGAVGAVLVVGVVLTALLATVAVTAVSVSIAALVLRSLLNSGTRR